jgi:catechol 2,3-dioxygenase-like lactoylglutathione lyase family enzyme
MQVKRVVAMSVVVKDFEAARPFFEIYLGLHPVAGCARRYRVAGDAPEIELIEVCRARLDPTDPDYAGHHFRHFGFEVASLNGMIQHSLDHGVRVFQIDAEGNENEITRPGQDLSGMLEQVLFVRDPDNNLWEFAERGRSTPILFEK